MSKDLLLKSESVAKSLFLGNIIEENLFPFPKIRESEAETLRMVIESIDKFMQPKSEDYRRYDVEGAQPDEYIQELRDLGLFGIIIPEEFGGLGLSNMAYARILQQTSRYDASTSLTIGAHASIGMKGLLLFGNDEQKKKYLPKLATGEIIAAFCLTEPGSGSDAASIKTRAEKQPDGTWILNGEKIWITNGAMADFFTVFARTESEAGKISAFIVERNFGGLSSGPKEDKMGIRASATTAIVFENMRLPAESLLGEEGHGFKIAMAILNNGRTGLGGGCVGGMKALLEAATRQASERKQFGKPVIEFALVQEKITQMTVNCFTAESIVTMLAHYIDSGVEEFSLEAAINKVYASEVLWQTAHEALQIAGGNGFMRHYPYERVVRDSRINLIYEGTNEILRLYIGLSGMKDVGDYLKELRSTGAKIFNDPIKGFGVLSSYASRKFTHLTSVGRDRLEKVHPRLQAEGAIYEQFTVRLNHACETVLRKLGKNIIGSQLITKRIADIAIDLFVGLCTLSRVNRMIEEKGVDACKLELQIVEIFTQQAKRRMNQNLQRLISNEDTDTTSVAEAMRARGSFPWDVFE